MAHRAPRAVLVGVVAVLVVGATGRELTQGVGVSATPSPNQAPQTRLIPVGTGSISGVVTAASTGRPLAGARVTVSGSIAQATGSAGPIYSNGPNSFGVLMTDGASGRSGGRGAGMESFVNRAVSTDASGAFTVARLPAGFFTISATRNQFVIFNYGERRPGGQGTPVTLADGQQLQLKMALHKGGVITGTIFGEDGQPLAGAQVVAWRYTNIQGLRRLNQMNGVTTDDRGMYRLVNLQPGDYVVSGTPGFSVDNGVQDFVEQAIAAAPAEPASPTRPGFVTVVVPRDLTQGLQAPRGYLPTFYPSTTLATSAATVHVAADEERDGLDIPLTFVRTTNLRGHVLLPPFDNVAVQLTLGVDDPAVLRMSGARTQPDGTFLLPNLAPGTYTLLAQTVLAYVPPRLPTMMGPQPPAPTLPDAQKLFGRAIVAINGEPSVDVDLSLQPGKAVSGVVEFEMQRPPDLSRGQVTVTLTPAQGQILANFGPPQTAVVGPDGRFTLNGVGPGRYTLRTNGVVKSAVVLGEDSLDFPFEVTGERDLTDAVVTVTDRVTEVSGTLADAQGQPAFGATVIIASADPKYWTPGTRRVQVQPITPPGRFTFHNLPAGEYVLAAAWDLEPGQWYDPEFLKTLTGPHVTLTDGGKVSQDLRIVR